MSHEEIELGKQWVERALNQYAQTFGVSIESLEWGKGNGDFENNRLTLAFYVNAKRNIQKFNLANLKDVANDKSVQVELDKLVRELVELSLNKTR